jgi:murein L,D-transpeptidase YcbB/YkuD
VNSDWALRGDYDAAADFAQARAAGRVAVWAAALQRQDPSYAALVAARARYAAMVAAGGWPAIADGPPLKPGARNPRVAALRTRLAAEGYEAPVEKKADLADAALTRALGLFQAAHGLQANGVLDSQTTAALNVTAQDRLATIDLNLERARWMPYAMPADRIEVDIASATVVLSRAARRP